MRQELPATLEGPTSTDNNPIAGYSRRQFFLSLVKPATRDNLAAATTRIRMESDRAAAQAVVVCRECQSEFFGPTDVSLCPTCRRKLDLIADMRRMVDA